MTKKLTDLGIDIEKMMLSKDQVYLRRLKGDISHEEAKTLINHFDNSIRIREMLIAFMVDMKERENET